MWHITGQTALFGFIIIVTHPVQGNSGKVPQQHAVKELYIAGLFPYTGRWHGGKAIHAAASLALEHVNANKDILPGYRLVLIGNDTKVLTFIYLQYILPMWTFQSILIISHSVLVTDKCA